MDKKFYVTTAIDYTNDIIHIGHAYQKIISDVLARYHRLIGDKTFFLTGTDEHGQKVEKSAKEKGINPKEFVDKIAAEDKKQWDGLNISYDRFIRTTDEDHVKFAQEFYLKAKANGDIYKKKYEGLYCEGCESFKEMPELVDGKCEFHPNKELQTVSEENYFFALSKYQGFLEELLENNPSFVQPETKRKEILFFIKSGLNDFSISRQNVSWGIPVPDDPNHTIYVWFDALINYLTYGEEEKCWPADIHVLGKDNQRFHAIYWPAMLKSAGYELPKTILVHDFISLNGQKVSKSLGNVILPSDLTEKYGVDGTRYYFLRFGPLNNDVDITLDKITEVYNADLANGLGNLVARVGKLAELQNRPGQPKPSTFSLNSIETNLTHFQFGQALDDIWTNIRTVDGIISEVKLWENTSEKTDVLDSVIYKILAIAYDLQPFLPETAKKVLDQFSNSKIKTIDPLFPRLTK